MPIYEYVCESCGELTEALRKISDPPLEICPACGETALRKKVSAAAFRLKGGGWYETDFKTGDKKKNLVGDDSKASGSSEKPADASKSASAEAAPSGPKASADKPEKSKGTTSGGSSSAT